MLQKTSQRLSKPFRLVQHSIGKSSKRTKDHDPHDDTAATSPVVSTTPSKGAAESSVTAIDASQPTQSSPVPASVGLQYPEQVPLSSGSPSSPVQQPAPTISPNRSALAPPAAPPALTTSRAQASPSAAVEPTPISKPEDLWDRAYDDIKADDPKLLDLYETILSHELSDSSIEAKGNLIETESAKRRSQMDALLNTGLDKTKKLANVDKNVGVAINIILSVKDAIGSALQPIPIAALAWTGVCVALQVSLPSEFLIVS